MHYLCDSFSLGATLEQFQTGDMVQDAKDEGLDVHQLAVVGFFFDVVENAQQRRVAELQAAHARVAAEYAAFRGESDKRRAHLADAEAVHAADAAEAAQRVAAARDEVTQLQEAYDALLTSSQDLEQHLRAVQKELEQHKAQRGQEREAAQGELARRLSEQRARGEADVAEAVQQSLALNAKLAQAQEAQREAA